MTAKEMFKKVESYNEIAELMRTEKAKINLSYDRFYEASFTDYMAFRKYVKQEFISPLPEKILNDVDWEFDESRHFVWTDVFGYTFDSTIELELVAM